jgi:hypothetical protein
MHQFTAFSDHVIHVRISGTMLVSDQRAIQHLVETLPDDGEKLRVLATLEDFQGWEKSEEWADDIGFLLGHGDRIGKMALIGEDRWKDDLLLFAGKGFRDAAVEFFPDGSRKEAEDWVRE